MFGDSSHLEGGVAGVGGGDLGGHDLCCVFEEYATSKRWLGYETSKGIRVCSCIDLSTILIFEPPASASGERCQAESLHGAALCLRHVAATRRELHRPAIAVP